MKKLISIVLLLASMGAMAAATDDNEIRIDQTGDTLTLYIDQVGFGNKLGLVNFNTAATKMTITGTTLTFDIDQIGNQNQIFGPLIADTSSYDVSFTGDSNILDWNIGKTGSSDDSDYDITVTGDSNTWNIDQGFNATSESLNLDLIVIGSSNVFDLDFDSDNDTWDWEVTGDSNNINTLQKDGEQEMTVDYTGDSGDIDINQISGTCVSGAGNSCSSPNATIIMDINSDNATIQINQKDAANDS